MSMLMLIFIITLLIFFCATHKRNSRGFNRKGIHKNGSKYDDSGYDVHGFDRNGYNRLGYDISGYNSEGYNQSGYNKFGRNAKGQYNRLFDIQNYTTSSYSADGFLNPDRYPISVTSHAEARILERISHKATSEIQQLVKDAYCFGKSKRQIRRSSTALIETIESKYGTGIVLIYHGYIYIFSEDNRLITVYKNDHIPL